MLIQSRRIDRGLGLVNRQTYTITGLREDGGLDVVATRDGTARVIPAGYLATDVVLGYACQPPGSAVGRQMIV